MIAILSYTEATSACSGVTSSTASAGTTSSWAGATCSAAYPAGTVVTLTVKTGAGSVFTGWSGEGCTGTGPCTVSLSAARAVVATFGLSPVVLTVSKAGTGQGKVVSTPAGIKCGVTCSASYPGGSLVILTANGASGSSFTGWDGGGCTGTGTCIVTMREAPTVTASFAR